MTTPRLIHISDTHFTDSSRTLDVGYILDSQNSRLRSDILSNYLINNKAQLKASKVVITGDLTDSGDDGDYKIAKAFIDKLRSNGFEVYAIPGNHDYSKEGNLILGQHEAGQSGTRRDNFIKYITPGDGIYPRKINLNDGWLVLLDSLQGEMDAPGTDNFAQGKLGDRQLSALKDVLDSLQADRKAGKKVIVGLHHSPFHLTQGDIPQGAPMQIDDKGGLDDAREFMDIVVNNTDGILFGHTSPIGILQMMVPDAEEAYDIPIINCENLEHVAWAKETPLGGFAQQICVGRNQDGRLEIFYVGTNGNIYHNWQTAPNGGWSGEVPLGGTAQQICVARNQDGRLEVFYIGTNQQLYHNYQVTPNGGWAGEQGIDGGFGIIKDKAFQLCVGQNQDGRLEIFYIGTNFNLYRRRKTASNGNDWENEERIDGGFGIIRDTAFQLCVGQNQDGRLEIFYVGTNLFLYHNWQTAPNGTDWHGEERFGNGWFPDTAYRICVGRNKDGRLEVFYIGTNLQLYHNYQVVPNGSWAGEESLSGLLDSAQQICVGQNQDGRLEIFYVGTNFKIYHNWQTLPNASYPISVIDMDKELCEVYNTDSPNPVSIIKGRHHHHMVIHPKHPYSLPTA